MHHPNLNSTSTASPQAHTIASICHTNDEQPPALQQNPPTDLELTTLPTTNYNQRHITAPQSPDNSEGIPILGKPSCKDATQSLSTPQTAITTQHHMMPYSRAQHYMNFLTTHATRVLPGSIWHHRIRCYQLQHYSPQWGSTTHRIHPSPFQGTLSKPNTATTTTLHKTQRHIIITSTEVKTALLPDLLLWYPNLPPIIDLHDAGRPGPPWPPPTKFPRILTPTANTDLSTDQPTATRPSRAWQLTDLLTRKPLRAIALSTCQYHRIHLSRQPKLLWYTPKGVTTTTPTTADKNLLRPP